MGLPAGGLRALLPGAARYISDLESAYQSLCRFYAGVPSELGTGSGDEDGSGDLTYDFHCDAPYLVAAFQQAYGIDLTTTKLHWWRFKALFAALPENTRMFQIMSYRAVDLSRLEGAERERYARLKDIYALPAGLEGGKRVRSVEDHNEAFLDRFRPREG